MYEDFKCTLERLYNNWRWEVLNEHTGVRKLMYTDSGYFRKDMKISQRVKFVKFKFNFGPSVAPWVKPHGVEVLDNKRFSVSTTGPANRVCWIASHFDKKNYIRVKINGVWSYLFCIDDLITDYHNISDEEVLLLDMLYPEFVKWLPKLKVGLDNIDKALRERFHY